MPRCLRCSILTKNIFFFFADGYIFAPGSFLFSLQNSDNLPPFTSRINHQKKAYAIQRAPGSGPIFGGGFDVYIANNAGFNNKSLSNFGGTYILPPGYTFKQHNTQSLLAGSYYFTPSEVEVLYPI